MNLVHVTVSSPYVSLAPLCDADREPMGLATADPSLWTNWPRAMSAATWDENFDWMLTEQKAGRWLLHTVRDAEGMIIGQTCYLATHNAHHRVEIGGTWYVARVHGTKVNPTCKLMMLENAFACGAQRVELKTDARNARSRAAMLKMGATFEGIHRQHMLRPDGTWRDTAWYSVLAGEWPAVKAGLEARLEHFAQNLQQERSRLDREFTTRTFK